MPDTLTPEQQDAAAFDQWLTFDLDAEGRYYENVPGDGGGPTKWGITWEDANEYLVAISRRRTDKATTCVYTEAEAAARRLSYLSEPDIRAIYKRMYWDRIHGGEIPSPTDEVLSDVAVNCGMGRATQFAERTVGLPDDGKFDNALVQAIQYYIAKHGQQAFCDAINTRREAYYNAIGAPGKVNHKFLAGWLARVKNLRALVAKALGGK